MTDFVVLFHVYQDTQGKWRWRLLNTTGLRIIAISSESYEDSTQCRDAVELVKSATPDAPVIVQPH